MEIKQSIKKMIKSNLKFMKAPPYVVGGYRDLASGSHKRRIERYLRTREEFHPTLEESRKAISALEERGIYSVPNYLSDRDFNQLLAEVKQFKESGQYLDEKEKDGYNVDWQHGRIPDTTENQTVSKYFRDSLFIKEVAQCIGRRKVHYAPEVVYQHLSLPEGKEDIKDSNSVTHVDRFYASIKVFYTLDDHPIESGPFVYYPKSHIHNSERMAAEEEYAKNISLQMEGRESEIAKDCIENGRIKMSSKFESLFERTDMIAPKNTLLFADVAGLHCRGQMAPGHSRSMLRMIFHYLHAPVFAQKVTAFFNMSPSRFLS